jgi:hypothetical protein
VPLTGVLKLVPLIVHGMSDALATHSESIENANKIKAFLIKKQLFIVLPPGYQVHGLAQTGNLSFS